MLRALRAFVPAVAGPAAFAAAAVKGARRVDDYSHRDEPMSALAARHTASSPVMVSGFLGLAACTFVLGRQLRGSRMPAAIAPMMSLAGLTVAGAGLARCSDRSCPTRGFNNGDVKLSDDLHGVFSAATFTLWIAMPFVAAVGGSRLRRVDRTRSLLFGATTLTAALVNGAMFKRGIEKGGGVSQRVMVSSALTWFPVAAIAAFRATSPVRR